MTQRFTIGLLAAASLITACGTITNAPAPTASAAPSSQPSAATTSQATAAPSVAATSPAAPAVVKWSYSGAEGPEFWGDLSPEFATCKTGQEQTPINVPGTAAVQPGSSLQLNWKPSAIHLENNGHTAQVNLDEGSTMAYQGKEYALKQFHFHAASEHQVAGKAYAMEAHFVHQSAAGELAVVGVMMETGAASSWLNPWWDAIPTAKGKVDAAGQVDPKAALPSELSHFTYSGSLTTPPCSEKVRWVLLTTPVTVSQAQIDKFTGILGPVTNRPLQPVNGRLHRLI